MLLGLLRGEDDDPAHLLGDGVDQFLEEKGRAVQTLLGQDDDGRRCSSPDGEGLKLPNGLVLVFMSTQALESHCGCCFA